MASYESTPLNEDTVVSPMPMGGARKVAVVAAGLMAVAATAVGSTMLTLKVAMPLRGDERSVQGLDGMVAVKPAYENCAQSGENCLASGCCAPAGYNCFKTASGKGRCMRACTSGGLNGTCEGVAPHMSSIVEDPGLSLFCFAAYTENTGNSKPNLELQLLQEQHK